MDAARVARRMGAEEALIVYRRTRAQMPAHVEEAEDAEREGVRINWLRTITALDGPELRVELDGTVVVSASLRTGCPGVFAGGDMVPGERTVTVGVGHGKKAARHIDAWLRGAAATSRPKHDLATFDMLSLWFFGDAARRQQPELAPEERVAGFGEVTGGLSVEEATYKAGRCLSCGNCTECDGCLGACPEDAVIKLGVGTATGSTTTGARAAGHASSSARCTRSRCSRSPGDARDG